MTIHRKDIGTKASIAEKQLGQARPGDTNNATLYSPPTNVLTTNITKVFVCNTTGNTPSYRIFIDDNGTTGDQTTALYYDNAMAANTTEIIELDMPMNDGSGALIVRSSAANEITFTAYGVEILKA